MALAGGELSDSTDSIIDGIVAALPRLGIAVALFGAVFLGARWLRKTLEPRLAERRTDSFGRVFSRLIAWSIVTVGSLLAVTVVFPSIKPVDLIAGLGIFSIALGFAFQDILSNLLAGILLLFRQPFEAGDQIEVNGLMGTVEGITIRETKLKTFDGKRIVVPNKDVYQSAIEVRTAFDKRRTTVVVGASYDDDLDVACRTALDAIAGIDGILDDPQPEAYLTEFGDSTMNFDLRYWTAPDQATVRRLQHEAVRNVKRAFDDNGLDIPFPIRTLDAAPSFAQSLGTTLATNGAPARP